MLFEDDDLQLIKFEPVPPAAEILKTGLHNCRQQPGILSDNDPLEFWAANQLSFPTLTKLARLHLCVQWSSVASERVFSSAEDVLRPAIKALCLVSHSIF